MKIELYKAGELPDDLETARVTAREDRGGDVGLLLLSGHRGTPPEFQVLMLAPAAIDGVRMDMAGARRLARDLLEIVDRLEAQLVGRREHEDLEGEPPPRLLPRRH